MKKNLAFFKKKRKQTTDKTYFKIKTKDFKVVKRCKEFIIKKKKKNKNNAIKINILFEKDIKFNRL